MNTEKRKLQNVESADTGDNSKDVKKICTPKKNDHHHQPKLTEYFLRNRQTVNMEGSPSVPLKAPKMVVVLKGTVDLPESSPPDETNSQKSNKVDKDPTDSPTNDRSSFKDSNILFELIMPALDDNSSSDLTLKVEDQAVHPANGNSGKDKIFSSQSGDDETLEIDLSPTSEIGFSLDDDECSANKMDETKTEKDRSKNLEFYKNNIKSEPNGDFIEGILSKWYDDYHKLEEHHGYIQWLFPIKESGMNHLAQPLYDHESEAIRNDKDAMERFIKAYKMMLNFYGFKLLDDQDGAIELARNSRVRLDNLNRYSHNNLRITRILKCLGEMGCEHLKQPLVEILIRQAFKEDSLRNCRRSCTDFWIPTLKDEEAKSQMQKLVKELQKNNNKDYRRRF